MLIDTGHSYFQRSQNEVVLIFLCSIVVKMQYSKARSNRFRAICSIFLILTNAMMISSRISSPYLDHEKIKPQRSNEYHLDMRLLVFSITSPSSVRSQKHGTISRVSIATPPQIHIRAISDLALPMFRTW